MKYHFLPESEVDSKGSNLHNPPKKFDRAFNDEWWRVWNSLDLLLSKRARRETWISKGPADYSLSEYYGESRSIQVFIHTFKLIGNDLCEILATFLNDLEEDYHIHCITEPHDRWYLAKMPIVTLVISKNEAFGFSKTLVNSKHSFDYVEDFGSLELVGFPPYRPRS